MMKRILLPLAIALPYVGSAQREARVQHSLLVDSAMHFSNMGNYTEAMPLYERIMRNETWPGPYFDAIHACLETGQPAKANQFLSIAVKHGFVPEVFRFDSLLMGHLASDASKPFRERRAEDEKVFAAKADSALIKELGAMYEKDQLVRKPGSDPAAMFLVDSANFERLIEICEQRGFPLSEGVGNVRLLLWHHRSPEYPGSAQWKRILPYIETAIAAGELSPSFLCMFDDHADQEAGRPMRYGALLGYYQSMPEMIFLVDRDQLDRNRASVGWGPISWFAEELGLDLSIVRFAAP